MDDGWGNVMYPKIQLLSSAFLFLPCLLPWFSLILLSLPYFPYALAPKEEMTRALSIPSSLYGLGDFDLR